MRAEIAVETFSILASVSGEWQMTASVTNESSVQLHLLNALLWRENYRSVFVKLPTTPQERGERERGNETFTETTEAESTVMNH